MTGKAELPAEVRALLPAHHSPPRLAANGNPLAAESKTPTLGFG